MEAAEEERGSKEKEEKKESPEMERKEEEEEKEREHTVKDRETLNSIAAFYDTTPSALAQYNKMGASKFIFPGKVLKIPPKEKPKASPQRQPPPKKHVVVDEEEIIERQFVKLNVRHITDGKGVVFGSLLVTPKTVMFNPNPTDLLVMETGNADGYQIIAPSENVVNFAIFNDFYKFNTSFGIAVKEEDKGTLYRQQGRPGFKLGAEEDTEEKSDEKENQTNSSETGNGVGSRQVSLDPMYLRLVMGKPMSKKLPRHAPIMSYGQQTLEPEYWFIIPAERVDTLHTTVNYLFPTKYGLLDHMEIERTGYEVIRPGVDLLEDPAEADRTCNRESVSRLLHKTLTVDFDLIAEMKGESEIILPDDRRSLAKHLPPRTDGHNWELYYGTGTHGYSLHHLYNKMADYDGPCLLVIKDVTGYTFGAYLTSAPRESKAMEGTGETFVFSMRPEFAAYRYSI